MLFFIDVTLPRTVCISLHSIFYTGVYSYVYAGTGLCKTNEIVIKPFSIVIY
jgi:hypothetical protein